MDKLSATVAVTPAPAHHPAALRQAGLRPPRRGQPRGTALRSLVSEELWSGLFGPPLLEAGELADLSQLAQLRQLPAGACVFRRGDAAPSLLAVLEGTVGLGMWSSRTGESAGAAGMSPSASATSSTSTAPFQLERAVHGPQWLDHSSAWLDQGRAQDACVLQPARLLELPLAGLRPLLQRHSQLGERLLHGLAQTVQRLTGTTHDLMAKDAQKRLATWLLQRALAGGEEIALKERKRELAAQLAITPETLSRLLRQLMSAGLIEVRGYSIKLLDTAALSQMAQC